MLIGVDYHPGFQQIAFFIEETGEWGERQLNHSDGQAERYYREPAAERNPRAGRLGGYRIFALVRAAAGRAGFRGMDNRDPEEIKAKRVRNRMTDREDARLMPRLVYGPRPITQPNCQLPVLHQD